MTYRPILIFLPALLLAAPASADPSLGDSAGGPATQLYVPFTKSTVGADTLSFSGDKGWRRTVSAQVARDFGSTALLFGVTQGERSYGAGKLRRSGVQGSAMLTHDWNGKVTSITSLSAASDSPVFGRFSVAQEFDMKVAPGTIARLGARTTRFFGGTIVNSGQVGLTQYFGGGFVSYRLSAFKTERTGTTAAHLASIQLKDPRGSGSTQLWLGGGSSRHEMDWMPELQDGSSRSVALRRVQPLGSGMGLSFSIGRTWYDRPLADYRGTRFAVGLAYKR